jgi:hypothetical protein
LLRAGLLLIVCWLSLSSQDTPTRLALDQVQSTSLEWRNVPPLATSPCLVGDIATDEEYNVYFCVPDKRYKEEGHKPYLWIRLKPDPEYLPPGYR